MPSHYEILGINKNATEVEIKKAYRSASLKYHPDRNSSSDAIAKIQQINEAYEILSDKEKKQNYDNELNGVRPNLFQQVHTNFNTDFGDINSMFNMMFNGRPFHPGMPNVQVFRNGNTTTHVFTSSTHIGPPPIINKNIEITLEQAYTGCHIPVEIEKWIQHNNDNKETLVETFMLEISEGINDNANIVIKGIGNQNPHGKGDVRFIIQVKNNTIFKRQNLNLLCDKEISLKEALCGFSFEFVHISGKKLNVNNNNPVTIIKNGQIQVFKGLGMKSGNIIGDIIFKFHIVFPNELTDIQRSHLLEGLP